MNIKVDNREDKSRIASFVKFFTGKDYKNDVTEYHGNLNHVFIQTLPIGDYLFEDKVIFEYKTPSDAINSTMDGRIFRQSQNMLQYPFSYVLIAGDVAEEINKRNSPKYFNKYNKMRSFTLKNYLGMLARLHTYTKVIHVDNNRQAWILMEYLVTKLLEENDVQPLDKPSFKLTDPIASFLGCIYVNQNQRVSSKQAVLIREHLHLETLEDLLEVSYEDLINVKGIGSKTARKIMEVLK